MIIRPEQMEKLSQVLADQFAREMVSHLMRNFPSDIELRNLDLDSIEQLVQKGIDEAQGYGIQYDEDIRLYLECLLLHGPSFASDYRDPVGLILEDPDKTGETKMAEISDFLVFGLARVHEVHAKAG